MISLEHRQQTISLIEQAVNSGARLHRACKEAGIDTSTYRRWQDRGAIVEDKRPTAQRPEPANKLTRQEREMILLTCHLPKFQSLPPSQIVPALVDQGLYLASESSYYRVLHEANQQHDRGRARRRQRRAKPAEYAATGPKEV